MGKKIVAVPLLVVIKNSKPLIHTPPTWKIPKKIQKKGWKWDDKRWKKKIVAFPLLVVITNSQPLIHTPSTWKIPKNQKKEKMTQKEKKIGNYEKRNLETKMSDFKIFN